GRGAVTRRSSRAISPRSQRSCSHNRTWGRTPRLESPASAPWCRSRWLIRCQVRITVPRETALDRSAPGPARTGAPRRHGGPMPSDDNLLGIIGSNISGTRQTSPFGNLPFQLAGALGGQEGGLLRAFGFGPRGPGQQRSLDALLSRGGPLASLANQVRGFAPTVVPEAQA